MSGSMSLADLVADLKVSLHDAANVFTAASDADFSRLLAVSAQDFGRHRPLLLSGSVTLIAGTASYDAPTDLAAFSRETWSVGRTPQPWEATYPGALPRVSVIGKPGARKLAFSPAPTDLQLTVLGSAFGFIYLAIHVIDSDATKTTVPPEDRGLLILRAQAEAMREMAMRNTGKPVTRVESGFSGIPRNGTPSHLFTVLMDEFKGALA